jgi:replicative superfamily II helicase
MKSRCIAMVLVTATLAWGCANKPADHGVVDGPKDGKSPSCIERQPRTGAAAEPSLLSNAWTATP